ncbi:MAG: hypothetical protein ACP5NY_04335 [Thermocladium sp.]
MTFRAFHVFIDTNVLVNMVYAITLHHRLNRPKPKILDLLENNVLEIYTSITMVNELDVALPKLLTSVDREMHGWANVEANEMEEYCISELNSLVNMRYVRVIEEDGSLELQRRALKYKPSKRVCWKSNIMDKLLSRIPNEDIDVINSLLYAYDLLATVRRKRGPGTISGKLVFVTEDKHLRNFIERQLTCYDCPCTSRIIAISYKEFKDQLRQI